jgi:hypothetical protein
MESCLRRAGARASGLLQDAAKENSEFYASLNALASKGALSFDPPSPQASPPHRPPPKAFDSLGDCSDDGDLFSRDGSSDSDEDGISRAFNISLDSIDSSDANLLIAFARACSMTTAAWRSEAAAHAVVLLKRMCGRAREIAESLCRGGGAAVAASAYMSHVVRVYLMVLPRLPPSTASYNQQAHMRSQHEARDRSLAERSVGTALGEEVHLAQFSRVQVRNEYACHQHQHQHQHGHGVENDVRLAWTNVWRNFR